MDDDEFGYLSLERQLALNAEYQKKLAKDEALAKAKDKVHRAKARIREIECIISSEFETATEWGESFPIRRQTKLNEDLALAKADLAKARKLATALIMKAKAK